MERVTHTPGAQHTLAGARRSSCSSFEAPRARGAESDVQAAWSRTRAIGGVSALDHSSVHRGLHKRSSASREDTSPGPFLQVLPKPRVAHGRQPALIRCLPSLCLRAAPDESVLSPADQRRSTKASKTTAPRPKQKAESLTLCLSPSSGN